MRPCRHTSHVNGCETCEKAAREPRLALAWARRPGQRKSFPQEYRPAPADGAGTELKVLLSSLGVDPYACFSCDERVELMNEWGVDECERRRDEIVDWIRKEMNRRGFMLRLKATFNVLLSKLMFVIDHRDPIGSLVDEAIGRARAAEKARSNASNVSEEANQGEVHPVRPNLPYRVFRWAYGVTTTTRRRGDLLPRTLASLKAAGFDRPTIFLDGANFYTAREYEEEFNLLVEVNRIQLRTHGNWIHSLYRLFILYPGYERFAIFQDDLIMSKNVKRYLELLPYPENGYCNLFTMPENQSRAPKTSAGGTIDGFYESNQQGRGAVALVFNKEAVKRLLVSEHMTYRPESTNRGWRAVDGGIVDSFRKIGWKEYIHSPSLVQHTGVISSMGNDPQPPAESFRGEEFDTLTLLPEELRNKA